MRSKTLFNILFISLLAALTLVTFEAQAQNQLGGHFGVVQPLATFQDGDNPNHFDPYTIGFPMGITVRKNEKFAYDLEIVSFISFGDNADAVNLLVHPGLLWGLGNSFTFGTRLGYEIGGGRYGFTPLLNKGFMLGEQPVFAEFVLPVRTGSGGGLSVTAALHLGVGF